MNSFSTMRSNHFLLTEHALSESHAREILANPECGAIVLFVGTVRNTAYDIPVLYLEFEAYEPMALRELDSIANEIEEEFGVARVLLHHRLGRVEVGEAAVIAGVAAKHRGNAFPAVERLMNRLKETVPIWKKEHTSNGAIWVSQHP
jgi:molybdopterin synthase catalytic subunit